MVLGVLSHLSHPHPQIEALTLDESLAGAFLLSPWVSFLDNWPSEYQNRYKDVVSKKCGQRWSAAYLNGEPADNWSEPLLANPDWWHAVKVGRVLVVAGSDEILLSSIIAFGEKFKVRQLSLSIFPLLIQPVLGTNLWWIWLMKASSLSNKVYYNGK